MFGTLNTLFVLMWLLPMHITCIFSISTYQFMALFPPDLYVEPISSLMNEGNFTHILIHILKMSNSLFISLNFLRIYSYYKRPLRKPIHEKFKTYILWIIVLRREGITGSFYLFSIIFFYSLFFLQASVYDTHCLCTLSATMVSKYYLYSSFFTKQKEF